MKLIKIDYSKLQNDAKEMAGRYYATLNDVNIELEKRLAAKDKAEAQKAYDMDNGTEAQYLKSCERLDAINRGIEYLQHKKANLLNACNINEGSLTELKKTMAAAQGEATKDYLKKAAEIYHDWRQLNDDFRNQLDEGQRIYNEVLTVWAQATGRNDIQFVTSISQNVVNVSRTLDQMGKAIDSEYYKKEMQ